jgi:hypothetical protein
VKFFENESIEISFCKATAVAGAEPNTIRNVDRCGEVLRVGNLGITCMKNGDFVYSEQLAQ